MDYWQKHPEVLQHKKDHERIFQNKLKFVDETGNQIPGNFTVYKDLMVFTELGKCNYFGGRCLLAMNTVKNVKKQIQRERGLTSNAAVNEVLREKEKEKQVKVKLHRTQSLDAAKMMAQAQGVLSRNSEVSMHTPERARPIEVAEYAAAGRPSQANNFVGGQGGLTHRIPTKRDP